MQDQEEEVKFSKTERGAEVLIYKGFDLCREEREAHIRRKEVLALQRP